MFSTQRNYNLLDRVLIEVQQGLASINNDLSATRPYPTKNITDGNLTAEQIKLSGRLMRVNHSGEICAQGLYQGQAITAKNSELRQQLRLAAVEEQDHLVWCYTRIKQLHTHTSYLNPLWYLGSLTLGACVGLFNARWNLGFLAETEKQVIQHLAQHLQRLPKADEVSRHVILQMHSDETKHANQAYSLGGATLPQPIPYLMRYSAKVMTGLAYWF